MCHGSRIEMLAPPLPEIRLAENDYAEVRNLIDELFIEQIGHLNMMFICAHLCFILLSIFCEAHVITPLIFSVSMSFYIVRYMKIYIIKSK